MWDSQRQGRRAAQVRGSRVQGASGASRGRSVVPGAGVQIQRWLRAGGSSETGTGVAQGGVQARARGGGLAGGGLVRLTRGG